MKRHVPRFSFSIETSAGNLFVFLTFVLQFLLGSNFQREEHLSVFFQFNTRIQNSQKDSSICIGPFRSDVSRHCGFDHRYYVTGMDCFNCYSHSCHSNQNVMDITNVFAGTNDSAEVDSNFRRLLTNRTLFVNLEVKCWWLKNDLLYRYVDWCEYNRWPNDKTTHHPKCPDTTTTKTTTKTWSSTWSPTTKTTTMTRPTLTNPITWTTTSSADTTTTKTTTKTWWSTLMPSTKTTTMTTLTNPITWTTTSSTLPTTSSNFSLWISLGATAIVFILTIFVILFCQRAKFATFLRKTENPDVVDDAFYYTDVSMGRRENQSDNVTYENVIPNLLHNEPINYIELDFNVQKNSSAENAAAEIYSTTLQQKRDIKGYVDSVIYAEIRK